MASTAPLQPRAAATGTGWILASGVMLAIAGVVALAAPGFTTLAASIFLGWLLVIVGIGGIVMGLRARRHRRWGDVALGVVSVLVGLYALVFPLAGAISLTLAFAVWLGVRGVVELAAAFRLAGPMRGALIVAGGLNLLLAVLLLANFPFPAVQGVGLFVGLSLLLGGVTTIVAGLALRRAAA